MNFGRFLAGRYDMPTVVQDRTANRSDRAGDLCASPLAVAGFY